MLNEIIQMCQLSKIAFILGGAAVNWVEFRRSVYGGGKYKYARSERMQKNIIWI